VRRPLHCLLVALLIVSLSVDTARACWYLRHAHRVHAAHACPPMPACHGGWTHAVVVSDVAVGHGWAADPCVETVVFDAGPFENGSLVEEIACGATVECCDGQVAHQANETVVTEHSVTTMESDPIVSAPTTPLTFENPAVVAESAPAATPAPAPAEPVPAPAPIEPVPAPQGEQSVVSIAEPQPVNPVPPAEQAVQPASVDTPVEPVIPEPAAPDREKMDEQVENATAPGDTPVEPILPEPQPPAPELPATPAEPVAPAEAVPEEPQPAAPAAPAEMLEEQAPPAAPEEPAEPNLFEEADASPVPPAAAETVEPAPFEAPSAPADEPPATPDATADESAPAAATEEAPMQDEAGADETAVPETDAEVPAEDAPVTPAESSEPPAEEAGEEVDPAADAAADPFSATEPARRWIDATGRYAVVGTLLAVRQATAEIRTADGRTVTVPLDRLSRHDREYAEQAGGRLLAGPAAPRPTDTAGM
jgi:hypothetical protein